MRTDIHVGFIDAFIFLGVFQGLLLSFFFYKERAGYKKSEPVPGITITVTVTLHL
jgi:hypothetical protein